MKKIQKAIKKTHTISCTNNFLLYDNLKRMDGLVTIIKV